MKINVVRQRAGLWVDEGDFDIVALNNLGAAFGNLIMRRC